MKSLRTPILPERDHRRRPAAPRRCDRVVVMSHERVVLDITKDKTSIDELVKVIASR